jgi:hypothetical protein
MMFIGRNSRMCGGETWKPQALVQILLKFSCFLVIALPGHLACCELVRFDFAGMFTGGPAGTYSLFSIAVPKNSPVRGSFSYETESQGQAINAETKSFRQAKLGGFTLDINNGAIRLSASDYSVTVADDLAATPIVLDLFSVDYDSRWTPPPAPLVVNDIPWSGATAFIKFAVDWPSTTFTGVDEPELTATRPLTPMASVTAFVGSSPTPRMFAINSISAVSPEPDAMQMVWSCMLVLAARAGRSRMVLS